MHRWVAGTTNDGGSPSALGASLLIFGAIACAQQSRLLKAWVRTTRCQPPRSAVLAPPAVVERCRPCPNQHPAAALTCSSALPWCSSESCRRLPSPLQALAREGRSHAICAAVQGLPRRVVIPKTTIVSRRGRHAHLLAAHSLHAVACGSAAQPRGPLGGPLALNAISRQVRWAAPAQPCRVKDTPSGLPKPPRPLPFSAIVTQTQTHGGMVAVAWHGLPRKSCKGWDGMEHAWRRVTQEMAKNAGQQPSTTVGKAALAAAWHDIAGRPPDMQICNRC